jgi:hypothetical protein
MLKLVDEEFLEDYSKNKTKSNKENYPAEAFKNVTPIH